MGAGRQRILLFHVLGDFRELNELATRQHSQHRRLLKMKCGVLVEEMIQARPVRVIRRPEASPVGRPLDELHR